MTVRLSGVSDLTAALQTPRNASTEGWQYHNHDRSSPGSPVAMVIIPPGSCRLRVLLHAMWVTRSTGNPHLALCHDGGSDSSCGASNALECTCADWRGCPHF